MSSESLEAVASAPPPRVAVVDFDRRVRTALAEVLRVAGLDVIGTAGDADTARDLVASGAQVLIIDPRMPDLASGEALVSSVVTTWPSVKIVITGWGDMGESRISRTAWAFIAKSADPAEFVSATMAACGDLSTSFDAGASRQSDDAPRVPLA
jgi:DNA-binding NtrC family response regulator